jgi:hypothetical protein
MSTHASLFNQVQDIVAAAKKWTCQILFEEANFSTSKNDGNDSTIVDLVALQDAKLPPIIGYPPRTRYMFPERFIGIESRKALIVEIKIAAIKCGFNLVVRNSKPGRSNDIALVVRLACERMMVYKEPKSNSVKTNYKTSTKRSADKESCCHFSISIFLQKSSACKELLPAPLHMHFCCSTSYTATEDWPKLET